MNDQIPIGNGSHIALLTKYFDKSDGDVMEIGTGYFSTLILHWFAHIYKRSLYSYENDPRWYKKTFHSNSKYHKIFFVGSWDELPEKSPSGKKWGLIFVDHVPKKRRIDEIKKFKDLADYIIIHDTQPEREKDFNFSQIWPLFKYIYHDNRVIPWTSVVSNLKRLK